MAKDTTKPQAPVAPAPLKGVPENGSAPAAEKKPKREPLQALFQDEAGAVKAAEERTKGPRRAFRCELNGKITFVVANNEGRAGGVAFEQAGGKVVEIGSKAKKPKQMGVDALTAAINSLPEEERAKVLAQLESLKK